MKKIIIISGIISFLVLSSFVGNKIITVNKVNNNNFKESNSFEYKDSNDILLDKINQGYKKISVNIDNNVISFDKSNTITDLNYSIYNKLINSDKSKWNIITNNLVEDYKYENNKIIINDDNINTISLSFIYNNDQYNLSLIKEEGYYRLVQSKVKLIHGRENSLWYVYFNDLESAIKAANKNDTIVLYGDIEVNNTIKVNKNINIISNPGNKYLISKKDGYLFKVSNKKINIKINNVNIKTNSFIKGKCKTKLNNTKIIKSIK